MIRLSQRLMTMIDDGRKGNNMGLSTGISKLDSLIYGVQRKWMYVVGAASGGGLKKAVPIEKLLELLESNIGEKLFIENPEINSEIAKGSGSSYSVESE